MDSEGAQWSFIERSACWNLLPPENWLWNNLHKSDKSSPIWLSPFNPITPSYSMSTNISSIPDFQIKTSRNPSSGIYGIRWSALEQSQFMTEEGKSCLEGGNYKWAGERAAFFFIVYKERVLMAGTRELNSAVSCSWVKWGYSRSSSVRSASSDGVQGWRDLVLADVGVDIVAKPASDQMRSKIVSFRIRLSCCRRKGQHDRNTGNWIDIAFPSPLFNSYFCNLAARP